MNYEATVVIVGLTLLGFLALGAVYFSLTRKNDDED
jgi:hypothetical protein